MEAISVAISVLISNKNWYSTLIATDMASI